MTELRELDGSNLQSAEIRYEVKGATAQVQAEAIELASEWLAHNDLLLVSITLQPDPDSESHLLLYVIGDDYRG